MKDKSEYSARLVVRTRSAASVGYECRPNVNFLVDELYNQLEKSFNIADGQGNLIERDRIEISLHDIT